MASKIDAMIKKITEDLKKLKVASKEAEKAKAVAKKTAGKKTASSATARSKDSKGKKADRPKSVGACKTKAQLMLFTVAELKEWLVAKKIEKITNLKKEDLVKLVLKKLKKAKAESESESSSSESDSDSDSYDSDCSECSDSDSESD